MALLCKITGVVEPGAGRGRTIGFPTANISLNRLKRAPLGVFVVTMLIPYSDEPVEGVACIGTSRTFPGAKKLCEVHILDFNRDLVGKKVTVFVHEKIRDILAFDSIEDLKKALHNDAQYASRLFDRVR